MPDLFKLLLPCLFVLFISQADARQLNKADTIYHQADTAAASKKAKDTIVTKTSPEVIPYQYQGIRKRSPVLACLLSAYIPGLGQIYNKQYLKAGIVFGTEVVFLGSALAISSNDKALHKNSTAAALLIVPFFAFVVYAVVDAPVSAVRLNNEYHLGHKKRDFSSLHISPNLINTDYAGSNKIAFGFSLELR